VKEEAMELEEGTEGNQEVMEWGDGDERPSKKRPAVIIDPADSPTTAPPPAKITNVDGDQDDPKSPPEHPHETKGQRKNRKKREEKERLEREKKEKEEKEEKDLEEKDAHWIEETMKAEEADRAKYEAFVKKNGGTYIDVDGNEVKVEPPAFGAIYYDPEEYESVFDDPPQKNLKEEIQELAPIMTEDELEALILESVSGLRHM